MRSIILLLLLGALGSASAQTFSLTVNQAVPDDGSEIVFELPVSGLPDVADSLYGLELVCFNLTHPYVQDMNIRLESPQGLVVSLVNGVGGDGDNFTNTCVAGSGDGFAGSAAPFSGTFQAYGDMGLFNRGQNPNGAWKLILYDTYAFADAGFLIDFSLTFGNNPAQSFVLESSNLPIVKLTTVGAPIDNEPKVPVLMQIIDNGPGVRNYAAQSDYTYEGRIMAEWQGFTGPYYPKKNYDFELTDDNGNEIDSTILGMPRESDWIFKAEYLDLTLTKNSIAYEMSRRMGRYAPRTRFCEMILDGEYMGVYTLTEKVKRDKNRVDIARLMPDDISGSDLTGGYIFEMNINGDPADWVSDFLPINYTTAQKPVEFKHVYPKVDVIQPEQAAYIRQYTADFEQALNGPGYANPQTGYRKWIDTGSFIDFLIVNEFTMNYDSYGRSTYLYKEKDTDGGLLHIGPPWDYDRALDYYVPDLVNYWVWERTHEFWPFPFWWSKLWQDPAYRQQLACRWQQLRTTTLSNAAFQALTDSLSTELAEAQARNFNKWKDLGSLTYEAHSDSMKAMLLRRLTWMDQQLNAEQPDASFIVIPTGISEGNFRFKPATTQATGFSWNFGDGATSTQNSPVHQYTQSGVYTVSLIIHYGENCSVTTETQVQVVLTNSTQTAATTEFIVSPNPFDSHIHLQGLPAETMTTLYSPQGTSLYEGRHIDQQDFSTLPAGVYTLKIKGYGVVKLVKQ